MTISEIDVEIPIAITSAFNSRNVSWAQRHGRARRERNAVVEALEGITRVNWDHYYVTLIRCGPRALDDDNLRGALKSIRDQISQWIGLDDNDARITWQYAQRRAKPAAKDLTSWARVRMTPIPHELAQDESLARLRAPRLAPTELDDLKQPRFVQKPRAIPELAGGKPERVIELQPRGNGVSSRLRVRLMKNTRDTGVGRGVLYCHVSVFWTDARKQAWRSQGVSIRLEEIRDVIEALDEYAGVVGVPLTPGGVISLSAEGGRETDTPSNNVNNPTLNECSPTNNNPIIFPPENTPGTITSADIAAARKLAGIPEPPMFDSSYTGIPIGGKLDLRPGALPDLASKLEDLHYNRVPDPDYTSERKRKPRAKELGIDCNATAEDVSEDADDA